jgi:hypothetical protein
MIDNDTLFIMPSPPTTLFERLKLGQRVIIITGTAKNDDLPRPRRPGLPRHHRNKMETFI